MYNIEANHTFSKLIYVIPNNLTEEFCNHCIEKFEGDDRKTAGMTTDDTDAGDKISTDLLITPLDEWKDEDSVFFNSLQIGMDKFLNEFGEKFKIFSYFKNSSDVGYQIQRTKPGEYYHWHSDYCSEGNSGNPRILTFIWYLNDIHEDGYTEFVDGTKVQPKTGNLLLFPSTWTYLHRGYPPKSETKYICTGWISAPLLGYS